MQPGLRVHQHSHFLRVPGGRRHPAGPVRGGGDLLGHRLVHQRAQAGGAASVDRGQAVGADSRNGAGGGGARPGRGAADDRGETPHVEQVTLIYMRILCSSNPPTPSVQRRPTRAPLQLFQLIFTSPRYPQLADYPVLHHSPSLQPCPRPSPASLPPPLSCLSFK
jgi:hypothetical protein